jgi:hypothetical protein
MPPTGQHAMPPWRSMSTTGRATRSAAYATRHARFEALSRRQSAAVGTVSAAPAIARQPPTCRSARPPEVRRVALDEMRVGGAGGAKAPACRSTGVERAPPCSTMPAMRRSGSGTHWPSVPVSDCGLRLARPASKPVPDEAARTLRPVTRA